MPPKGPTLADWTEADLVSWLANRRVQKAALPASQKLANIETTDTLTVSNNLQLSPQAIAYLNGVLGPFGGTGPAFKVNGTFDDVNLSTEQSLISGAVASGTTGWQIPANKLGTTGMLRFVLAGDYQNQTGGGQNITMKAKFGGSTLWGNINSPGAITRTPFLWSGVIANIGATNSQILTAHSPVFTNSPGGATVAGTGSPMTNTIVAAGSSAIDTTLSQFFDLTAQHGAANASLSIRRHFAFAEYL